MTDPAAEIERRRTRSGGMSIERERGITVVTSVMTFEYKGCVFNLLNTPGHESTISECGQLKITGNP